ncbi:MAG: uncharacterized protein JWN61_2450 [Pseudonocardiales bacterium]|nr:uncharacterized protein [Jatrophihabitantaceae bacterium]MCW2604315.1 uncharacterized protein [Pseudonocardiales bacterium]
MSSDWGRIDDEGTVYVRTADGERAVGSWHAGDAEAGLAHFVRRYDDLATEVTLLEKRLASGAGDPKATRAQAATLRESLPTAAVVGDLDALAAKLVTITEAAQLKLVERSAEREKAKADAVAAKEALIAEAQAIAETSTQWKRDGDRLRAIPEEWKLIKGTDSKTDDALWKRFASARDAFSKRRGTHFASLDNERSAAKSAKERLIAEAEKLAQSSEWRETADALKELMQQWKDAPRSGRAEEDELWKRFRGAQDVFFARRSEQFAERDAEQEGNKALKLAIIAEAEALSIANPKAAQTALRGIQERFDEVGHVPRDSMRPLDDRMRAAEQRVREAVDAEWRGASTETSPFLIALRARLAEAEEKLAKAVASGDPARIAKAQEQVEARKSLLAI